MPRSCRRRPHTGVKNGTNIATRFWYALYAAGYFESEIDSVKSVEEKKRRHSARGGTSETKGVISPALSLGRVSVAQIGKKAWRIYEYND